MSAVVRHVRLPIIHNDICQDLYSNSYSVATKQEYEWWVDFDIRDDMICAGYMEGGMDTCQVCHPTR